MTALSILDHFLETSGNIAPRGIDEIAETMRVSRSTAYAAVRRLEEKGMLAKVKGGYILGKKLLLAGAKYHAQLSRIQLGNIQEKLYGSTD
jgi:DNA-binding IclR family transcriptional regulator